ncbi:uncharacterized protein LOC107404758 isoform X1 [Ziziphus jujuba]|uniref:Uncharacterized protein LOC107404758 isoform X1 n=1 Tax=Ziziphus jujuba TaxID=326968 RepID=A0A6P3YZ45_ZIZJJ|nr:uncharacterized protein LOC107404758 isoform X1 [Ziziphus jujuba]
MLCSVPAGKSGSNWLDRLRSNKGFPTGDDDLDLDHFLTQNPSPSSSDSPHSIPPDAQGGGVLINRSEISRRTAAQDKEWYGIMSNVLSELFYMGGSDESSKLSGKKIPRKQTKPKLCVVSTRNNNSSNSNTSVIEVKKSSVFVQKGENAPVATASLNSDSNSLVETKAGNVGGGVVDVDGNEDEDEEEEEEEEEEKGERELKGYSRSEVTVIDTSCGLWKSEKLVFRRKNAWKVREKKGKLRSFGRKKRKGNDNGVVVVVGGKKKAKVLASEEDNGDQCTTPSSNERNNLKNDSGEEVCKAATNNLDTAKEEVSKDLRKRFIFSRSPRKIRKGGSAVVLIKGIPADKKNISKLSNNIAKGTYRQPKV